MNGRDRQLPLEEARPGVVLAADVLDPQGSVLLPKGAELSEALLRALRRRGIGQVRVACAAVSPQLRAQERARAGARLARLFRHAGQGPADALLREAVTRYRMEALE